MPYKVIHTSDWHLGKKLFKESRLPEQEAFLSWLLVQIKNTKANALCISGDIFDTPHPSTEAQSLYYQFLKEASSNPGLEIFIISGNHDSGRFLEAPLPFLKDLNIHIVGSLGPEKKNYSFHRNGVSFHLLPYFRSHELYNYARAFFPEHLKGLDAAANDSSILLERLINQVFDFQRGNQNILLGHHLFGNGELSGSELGLSLSGLDSIPLGLLKNKFDYVALGHLHNHQYLSGADPIICYSGSPIAFRFSERKNKKINIIDFESQSIDLKETSVPEFRRLYELKLNTKNYKENLHELVKNHQEEEFSAFLEVQISSNKPLKGVADEIREMLANSPIKLLSLQTKLTKENNSNQETVSPRRDKGPCELFKDFYLSKFEGEKEVPLELINLFNELLEDAREGQ